MPPKKSNKGLPVKKVIAKKRQKRNRNMPQLTEAASTSQIQNDLPILENEIIDNIESSESTDSESEIFEQISSKNKPKIQIFKGFNDRITIENWLKRYEMISKFYNFNNKNKVIILGNFLEDEALNWYVENCNDYDFESLKIKLIARFGIETVEPIVEFFNLKYNIKTGIKSYFEEKRRYGVSAKLTEIQMIPIMIQGLHAKMIDSFVAVKPKTFSEFYSIAKTAENNLKRNNFQFNNYKSNENKNFNSKSEQIKTKKKPPNPCKICEGLGHKNRYHWAQDCRNKSANNSNNSNHKPKVNSIDKNSNYESNQIENDISNINLN